MFCESIDTSTMAFCEGSIFPLPGYVMMEILICLAIRLYKILYVCNEIFLHLNSLF